MIKEIKTNMDGSSISNSDFSKSIIVKVDKGLLEKQARITNELIEIGYDEIYIRLEKKVKDTLKYLKKVNLDKPFKQNIAGKFFGVAIDADLLSSTTLLFENLRQMVYLTPLFKDLFDELYRIEHEYQDLINKNDFGNTTAFNKTSLLANMEGLKQIILSLITLYNCYRLVLKNPKIKAFFTKWLEYKKRVLSRKYQGSAEEYNSTMLSRIEKL